MKWRLRHNTKDIQSHKLIFKWQKRDKLPVSLFKEKQEKEKQKHAVLEMRKMKSSKQESLRGYMLLQGNTLTAKRNG